MISTRLRGQAHPKQLLIEFSDRPLPLILDKFYNNCKEEGILVRRDKLKPNQINFYQVDINEVMISEVKLHDVPSKFSFVFSVCYLNSEEQDNQISQILPTKRTLLLREGLDAKFFFNFQYQNTLSEQESLVFLCQISASIINSSAKTNVSFYDQKTEQIKRKQTESSSEILWKNIFFQIPGLGRQKCVAITQKYPTYQSLLCDYNGLQMLKNLVVSRGTKEMKLGAILAQRIYKCLLNANGSESIYQE